MVNGDKGLEQMESVLNTVKEIGKAVNMISKATGVPNNTSKSAKSLEDTIKFITDLAKHTSKNGGGKKATGAFVLGNVGEVLGGLAPKYENEIKACKSLPEFELILRHMSLDATRIITDKSPVKVPEEISNKIYATILEKIHALSSTRELAAAISMEEDKNDTNYIVEKYGEKSDGRKMVIKEDTKDEDEDGCDCEFEACHCNTRVSKEERRADIIKYRDAISSIKKLYQDTLELFRITDAEGQKIMYRIRQDEKDMSDVDENLLAVLLICTELEEYKLIYRGLLMADQAAEDLFD